MKLVKAIESGRCQIKFVDHGKDFVFCPKGTQRSLIGIY